MTSTDEFSRAEAAAQFLLSKISVCPKVGLILGSGLGSFAEELSDAVRIPYTIIPCFPQSTAIGHAGQMVIGKVDSIPVVAMQGRVHLYEGYTAQQVAFPVRVFGRMGIRALLITNAAGGINLAYKQGALVLIRDHINLQGQNPLVGANDDRFGLRFPDMTQAYSEALRDLAKSAARDLGKELPEGVYAALLGPSYETPAEIRYLRSIGADLVGMSTVPEVIAASHMGIKVLAISCVTNMAAGILDKPLSYVEVFETTERVRGEFVAFLRAVILAIEAGLKNNFQI
jgi:purine-nucleoside phosphorylase